MRVLLDTDVVLDLLLDRAPFSDAAAALWQAHERGQLDAYISAITPVNVFYIARKLRDELTARQAVAELLLTLNVCGIDHETLRGALTLSFHDFEDAVQSAAADAAGLEAIITRNDRDYELARLPVYTPGDFVERHLTPPPQIRAQ